MSKVIIGGAELRENGVWIKQEKGGDRFHVLRTLDRIKGGVFIDCTDDLGTGKQENRRRILKVTVEEMHDYRRLKPYELKMRENRLEAGHTQLSVLRWLCAEAQKDWKRRRSNKVNSLGFPKEPKKPKERTAELPTVQVTILPPAFPYAAALPPTLVKDILGPVPSTPENRNATVSKIFLLLRQITDYEKEMRDLATFPPIIPPPIPVAPTGRPPQANLVVDTAAAKQANPTMIRNGVRGKQ